MCKPNQQQQQWKIQYGVFAAEATELIMALSVNLLLLYNHREQQMVIENRICHVFLDPPWSAARRMFWVREKFWVNLLHNLLCFLVHFCGNVTAPLTCLHVYIQQFFSHFKWFRAYAFSKPNRNISFSSPCEQSLGL